MECYSGLKQIGPGEGTGGIETSDYPEERKANATPLVAASEEGRDQTVSVSSLVALLTRGCGTHRHRTRGVMRYNCFVGERSWKDRPQWVIAPYSKASHSPVGIPSNARTEQTGVNLRGPPRKSKYSLATDSEPVP